MQLENAPKGWKINSTKKVYSNYLLELYEDALDLNGKEKIYLRGVRRYIPKPQIEVPSGYIDEGECPEQAAIRELKEETGYAAKDIIPIGDYTLDYTMFEQKGNLFVAYGLVKEQGQSLGLMEKIDTKIMNIMEIKQLLFEGRILNAASIVALYRALDFHNQRYNII